MSITVNCYPYGPLGENTYLIADDQTNKCAVIDPGYFGDVIISDINKCSSLDFILLTHGHYDHFASCLDYLNDYPETSLLVGENDIIRLGETEIRIIGTPGHTSGGITFYADNIAFTGDTLFRLSVGVTNYKTGNCETMVRTIQTKIYALPDDTIVYPGHGPATTIGFEKKNNPFVKSCVAD